MIPQQFGPIPQFINFSPPTENLCNIKVLISVRHSRQLFLDYVMIMYVLS